MNRGTGSLRSESRRSFRNDKKLCNIDEVVDSSSTGQQKVITIVVGSIENIDPKKIKEIIVKIEYSGSILGQSFPISVLTSEVDIGVSGTISTEDATPQFVDEILSNPVLFTVLDCSSSVSSIAPPVTSPNLDKDSKKKIPKASNSPISGSKSLINYSSVLGICNLDMGALVMGQTRINETLLVEPDKKVPIPEQVNWVKLPKLVISVSTEEPLIPPSENKFNNILGITVESIYNVPGYIAEGSLFDAIIPVPSSGELQRSNNVKFPNGTAVSLPDSSCRKKWLNLLSVDGRGARSKYSVSSTSCDVISTLPDHVILENEMSNTSKLIQWNIWRNFFMLKKDVNCFFSKIMKHRVWPVEISIPNKSKEVLTKDKSAKSEKKSKPIPSTFVSSTDHFSAFLDLSALLYPGVTKTRVAAQLYTYSQSDLLNKCGSEFPIQASQGSVITGKKSEKSKASVRESEDNRDSPGVPIFNDEGSPTFIIVEIELKKPFTPKRNPEYIEQSLKPQISLKGKIVRKTTHWRVIHDSFSKSLKDMVSILSDEHQTFTLSLKNQTLPLTEDFDIAFQKYLCKSENFYKIRNTLEKKVVDLINEKYGAVNEYEDMIPDIYVYLVTEMHKITNNCFLGHKDISNTYFNLNDLQLYAEECIEEGDYEAARNYLLLKLSRDTSNPDYWLDYAVFCIDLEKFEAAVEAVREALNLNFHHQIGLIMYALLMARFQNGTVAEQTFDVLLAKYPNFIEGWLILRLFYAANNNIEGVFMAKNMATKLECERKNKPSVEEPVESDEFQCTTYNHDQSYDGSTEGKYGMASFRNGISWVEPLSWTLSLCSHNNTHFRTQIILLKLGFYEYASMSLSNDLLCSGANENNLPPHYLYYTSVNYYLQGRYEEAVSDLLTFVKDYGKDCFIWSLLGHCYYKLQNHEKAISCYEYVMESYNRPDDIHLIYLRMGFYYIQVKKFPCAKQVFTTACKYSPSPKLWKGIGIACLRMNELEEAETAFTEANYLDNRDPETWAYLGITNAMSRRVDMFKNCYLEAKKRHLQNEDLEEEIKYYINLHGLNEEDF